MGHGSAHSWKRGPAVLDAMAERASGQTIADDRRPPLTTPARHATVPLVVRPARLLENQDDPYSVPARARPS